MKWAIGLTDISRRPPVKVRCGSDDLKAGERVLIVLSPSMLEVAVRSKIGISSAASRVLNPETWTTAWENRLTLLDDDLRELLSQVGARGSSRAEVYYTSPDSFIDVHSLPAHGETAMRAATLALADRVTLDLAKDPSAVVEIGRDFSRNTPNTHMLLAVDKDENCQSVAVWVERCGAIPAQITPMSAVVSKYLVTRSLDHADESEPYAVIYVGEHHSTIAGSGGGRLRFVRTFAMGFGMLVDAYCRGAFETERITAVERADARRALFGAGLPTSPTDLLPIGKKARASAIMPLIQPVIQRFLVETRQTLRFGFGETTLQRVRFELIGPGSRVPGFAEALSMGLEIEVITPDAKQDLSQTNVYSEDGDMHLVGAGDPCPVNLVPSIFILRKRRRRLGMSMRVGAVAAAALLAADAATTYQETRGVEAQLRSNEPILERVAIDRTNWERAAELSAELVDVRSKLVDLIGERTNWELVLREIGRASRPPIRLTHIQGAAERESIVLTIRGFAFDRDGATGSDALSAYLERLNESAVTSRVAMGTTQRAEIEGQTGIKFVIEARVVALPLAGADLGRTP